MDRAIPDPPLLFSAYSSAIPIHFHTQVSSDRRQVNIALRKITRGTSVPDNRVMFFYSDIDPASWGANLKGSPIVAISDPQEHLTQFVVATQKWSDGTEA